MDDVGHIAVEIIDRSKRAFLVHCRFYRWVNHC